MCILQKKGSRLGALLVRTVPFPYCRAVEIAWICTAVSDENWPMPPILLLMPVWIIAGVAPWTLDVAIAPWQLAQLAV